ncbi:MAG: ABC transporter ATP-binding protein [Pseudomonadota bacterium]
MAQLEVSNIAGGYGPIKVLFDISLSVDQGEVVALVGRNGMGKTTTIKMITGALASKSGSLSFGGTPLTALPSHKISRLGIGLVPEGRQVFSSLSVEENLALAERVGPGGDTWTVEAVFQLFPRLRERRNNQAATLSGGEQQKLAIGRALVTNPKLIILDEATEGLAPLIRQEIWACLNEVTDAGMSALVVDKNLGALSKIASRFVVVSKGETVWDGSAQQFMGDENLKNQHLGV